MSLHEMHLALGMLLLRLVTGIIFFFQGYAKIFRVSIKEVVEVFKEPMDKTWIPTAFLKPFAWITSILELVGGFMLVMGIFRDFALYLLAFDLFLVAFAFSSIKAMWDMQYYFPRFVFVLLLLMLPPEWDSLCLETVIPMLFK
ncbi:MAG: DoxX family membrane protein [Bacteroidetes bacterium]|nr:MAG: DoxX family membrane protein [Bacteroidota bacterium]REK05278.1 MAG: DoxX family membrane protein [Bacteroidota bacterium]REK32683.1 MAG: DoxX family membrane protein [Bacteroidota bacterium]REK48870.1 MAG: DoxX family membrane protein [Bacteroidota bacterium]